MEAPVKRKKSRCLLVSVDNRKLSPKLNGADYVSLNAVITQAYAKYHNYDYIYIENSPDGLYDKATAKYSNIANKQEASDARTNVAKDVASALHVGLKQFRAASWAKLPPLWYLTAISMGLRYVICENITILSTIRLICNHPYLN